MELKQIVNKVESLLEAYKSDVRDFDYTLNRLVDMVTEEVEGAVKKDREITEAKGRPTPDGIKRIVGDYYNAPPEAFTTKLRNREFVRPRRVAMFLCTVFCDDKVYTLGILGKAFGDRHHSTVIAARDSVEAEIKIYKKFRDEVLEINDRVLFEYPK